MQREEHISIQIRKQGLLPLFYHPKAEVCLACTEALYAGGIRVLEFTNRGEHAFENFRELVRQRDKNWPGLLLGIGTVRSGKDAARFIDHGADLLVSPVYDTAVSDVTYMQKVLWIPGCMTPTEIHMAEQAGSSLIKLFPGQILGTSFIEAVRPLFPGLDFMVTGGVEPSRSNIKSWLAAGASCLGIGSKLISPQLLESGQFSQLTDSTKEVLEIIRSLRSQKSPL
jgi:2-dehydro-3-deoxyphosphogluconate aldolase / (4S)-4-hydroxy-2-oxoglutarate aldolase